MQGRMQGGMEVPRCSQAHPRSSCGQRELSSQPLNTHPRTPQLGVPTFPHLTVLRPTSTKATYTRERQPGSKAAQRGQWPQEGPAFTLRPAAGTRGCWGAAARAGAGRGGGQRLPHPALLSAPFEVRGLLGLCALKEERGNDRDWRQQQKGGAQTGSRGVSGLQEQPYKHPGCFPPCLPPGMAL